MCTYIHTGECSNAVHARRGIRLRVKVRVNSVDSTKQPASQPAATQARKTRNSDTFLRYNISAATNAIAAGAN